MDHGVSELYYASTAVWIFCVAESNGKSVRQTSWDDEKKATPNIYNSFVLFRNANIALTDDKNRSGSIRLLCKLHNLDDSMCVDTVYRSGRLAKMRYRHLLRPTCPFALPRQITMRNRNVIAPPQYLPDEMPRTNWLLFVLLLLLSLPDRHCPCPWHPFISFIVAQSSALCHVLRYLVQCLHSSVCW